MRSSRDLWCKYEIVLNISDFHETPDQALPESWFSLPINNRSQVNFVEQGKLIDPVQEFHARECLQNKYISLAQLSGASVYGK